MTKKISFLLTVLVLFFFSSSFCQVKSQLKYTDFNSMAQLDVSGIKSFLKAKGYNLVESKEMNDDSKGKGTLYRFAVDYDENRDGAVYWVLCYLMEDNSIVLKHTFYNKQSYFNQLKSSFSKAVQTKRTFIDKGFKCDKYVSGKSEMSFCSKYISDENTSYEIQLIKEYN